MGNAETTEGGAVTTIIPCNVPSVGVSSHSRLASTLGVVFAVWLLSFFLLPNTPFAALNPFAHFSSLVATDTEASYVLIISIATATVWWSYLGRAYGQVKYGLWLLIGVYLSVFAVTALVWRSEPQEVGNCVVILSTLCAGLLAARACGSADTVVVALCALALAQGAYTLYYAHIGQNATTVGTIRQAGGTFARPSEVCTLMLAALPASLALALKTDKALPKAIWTLCASITFAALILTSSPISVLGMAIGISWLIYRLFGHRWNTLIALFSLFSVVCMMVVFRYGGSPLLQAVADRSPEWTRGLIVFQCHWLTGVGAGEMSIPIVAGHIHGPGEAVSVEAGNELLHWLDEFGVGGGVLFVSLAVALSNVHGRSRSIGGRALGAAWLGLLAASMGEILFGAPECPCGNTLLGLLLGAALLLPEECPATVTGRTKTTVEEATTQ